MTAEPRRIVVLEYEGTLLPRSDLPDDVAELLWQRHGERITVDWPSPATGQRWRLTSRGWVGYLPLAGTHLIELAPRVPLGNLFGMLEYAYHLRSFRLLAGDVHCTTLAEFYERLAHVLAKRVIDRAKRGLHRSYVGANDDLAFVRGRLDVQQILRAPWRTSLPCTFEEHTADVDDNAILFWTLDRVVRSGLCTDRSLPTIRAAHRRLEGSATLQPFTGADCADRVYSRLNADYEPMHGLCRFFLENCGPTHERGDRSVLPFLVHMPLLFEGFVAAWLQEHAQGHFRVDAQHRIDLEGTSDLEMVVDVLLSGSVTGYPVAVLDTKYKVDATPSTADVSQVVTYAQALGCRHAVLVYPGARKPFRADVGDITVTTATFSIADDLEASGRAFLAEIERLTAAI
jgi:5-methylcytosine-specific restriction enzyme subunit McrC